MSADRMGSVPVLANNYLIGDENTSRTPLRARTISLPRKGHRHPPAPMLLDFPARWPYKALWIRGESNTHVFDFLVQYDIHTEEKR